MVTNRVIVIGAGASGMMAAGRAAESGVDVLLLEKMPQPGKKLLISGKSRCNLTNSRDMEDFIMMYGPNGRFLYSAFHRFFRDDLLFLLRQYGIETVTERGGRIFPVSGDAGDMVKALRHYIGEHKVRYHPNTRITGIDVVDKCIAGVNTEKAFWPLPMS